MPANIWNLPPSSVYYQNIETDIKQARSVVFQTVNDRKKGENEKNVNTLPYQKVMIIFTRQDSDLLQDITA